MTKTAPAPAPAAIHGRYRVIAVAGRAASGCVLEVQDLDSGEPRALKIVAPGPHEAMLLDEFEQLARLRHPSLPRVFEVGRTREAIDLTGYGPAPGGEPGTARGTGAVSARPAQARPRR